MVQDEPRGSVPTTPSSVRTGSGSTGGGVGSKRIPPLAAPKGKRKLIQNGFVIRSKDAEYTVMGVLGSGGFGDVYKVQKNKEQVTLALKTEDVNMMDSRLRRLKVEAEVLTECGKTQNKQHFIGLIDMGITKEFKFIVMPVVGTCLDKLRSHLSGQKGVQYPQFSTQCAHKVCVQIIEAVRDLHDLGFLHRDLKPANFAIGLEESERCNLIMLDFGIAKRYKDSKGNHITPRCKVMFMGTLRFAPRAAHRYQDQSRKDDLESMLYLLVDMFNNRILPWIGRKDTALLILLKENFMIQQGSVVQNIYKQLPRAIEVVANHIQGLDYAERPNYEMLINEMRAPVKDNTEPLDWIGYPPPKSNSPKKKEDSPSTRSNRSNRSNRSSRTKTKSTITKSQTVNKSSQESCKDDANVTPEERRRLIMQKVLNKKSSNSPIVPSPEEKS